jgi:anti-sigma factor RsiW
MSTNPTNPTDPTNPADMNELLGAYALDAVDEDERRAVEEYLAANPRARAEVQEHREVATMLAWSGMDAPDGLWDRISASLDERDAPELGQTLPMRRRSRRAWMRSAGAWVAATAAAALIAFVAVRLADRDNSASTAQGMEAAVAAALSNPDSVQAQLTSADDPNVKVRAVVDPSGHGYLLADSLPDLDPSRTYQLWGQIEGAPDLVSLGLLGADPHTTAFTVDGELTMLAITNEVAGGVVSSSNPVVVAGAPA